MALHGLNEQAAIDRLAAEDAASDLYQEIRSMNLSGYAGAWFDAETGRLHVASNDPAQMGVLNRLGARVVSVKQSLGQLEAARDVLLERVTLELRKQLKSLHIDYALNRVVVAVPRGQRQVVRNQLIQDPAIGRVMDMIELMESDDAPLELTAQFRGADGTRNHAFEQDPLGTGYYPCSIGAATTNGFYTAGHCGKVGNVIKYAAGNTRMGVTKGSSFPYQMTVLGDIGWVRRDPGWTPLPSFNGYSEGIISVPAKWSGTAEAPIGATVCRYGQASGGPHCGVIVKKGLSYPASQLGIIGGVTEVEGSCSSDGDSGGPWLSGGRQIQGTTIGRSAGNICGIPANERPANPKTYFQPVSHHIGAYASAAGSLLTSHGANQPVISGFLCPDMGMSGEGTWFCSYEYYNAQGRVDVVWQAPNITFSSNLRAAGTCLPGSTVNLYLKVGSAHGIHQENVSFPCPVQPIP